jgi:hypothetical protein
MPSVGLGPTVNQAAIASLLVIKIITQFMSGTSYLLYGRLHVSVLTGPSSGLLMNQASNAAYMLGSQLCLQLV